MKIAIECIPLGIIDVPARPLHFGDLDGLVASMRKMIPSMGKMIPSKMEMFLSETIFVTRIMSRF
jgi:hypothetical protein